VGIAKSDQHVPAATMSSFAGRDKSQSVMKSQVRHDLQGCKSNSNTISIFALSFFQSMGG
jgi:hypothetical protein